MLRSVDTIMSLPGFSNALPEVGHGAPGYSNPREVRGCRGCHRTSCCLGVGRWSCYCPGFPYASSLQPCKKPCLPLFVSLGSLIHSAHSVFHRNTSFTLIFHLYYSRRQTIIHQALLLFLKCICLLLFVTPHFFFFMPIPIVIEKTKQPCSKIAFTVSFHISVVLVIPLCIF